MEEEPKKPKVKRVATAAQLENLRKAREAKAAKKAAAAAEPVTVKVEEKVEKVEEPEETETPQPAPPPKKVVLKKTPLAKKAEATVKRVKKQQAHAPTSREMKAAIQQARRAKEQAEEKQHSFDALVEQKVRSILREKAKAEALARQQAEAAAVHEEEDDEEEEEDQPAGMIEVTESDEDGDDGDDGDGYVSPPVKPPVKPPKRVSNHVQFQPDQQQPLPPWLNSVYARDPYMMKMAQRLGYS